MNRSLIKNHMIFYSILIFIVVYGIIHLTKPGMMYGQYGELRQFGLNKRNKTIFPAWLISIVIAILSYLTIRFYTIFPFISKRI
jgi:hypothetical protein